MKDSEFAFNYIHLLYYKSHEINTNRGVLYIDSSSWVKHNKNQILSLKRIINAFNTL